MAPHFNSPEIPGDVVPAPVKPQLYILSDIHPEAVKHAQSLFDCVLTLPSPILLNTARGGIVNEDDLADALEQRQIWGAGFDCHVQEPPTLQRYDRLWWCPRFVGTPHIAAATHETQIATIDAATDKVYGFLMGRKGGVAK